MKEFVLINWNIFLNLAFGQAGEKKMKAKTVNIKNMFPMDMKNIISKRPFNDHSCVVSGQFNDF